MSNRMERLWRRLDAPGHEGCAIFEENGARVIDGMAVFRHVDEVARLRYSVECDSRWITRRARVEGWVGARRIELDVAPGDSGGWTMNGEAIPHLDDVVDVDLGFTPATNTIAIRRLELAVGEERSAPAAWLDTSDWRLRKLDQSYRRVAANVFHYRAPEQNYEGRIVVDDQGIVVAYPGLWQLIS